MGSRVTSSDSVNVGSDENLVRMNNTPVSLTTQAHNTLDWSIRVLDSNGTPVKGAKDTDPDEVGVGDENHPTVTLGHVCDQTIQ